MRATVRSLVRSRDGAAMLEFALAAPPAIALIVAILMDSLAFFTQQGLETAAEAAGRLLMTGNAQQTFTSNKVVNGVTLTPQQQYQSAVCSALPVFLSCSRLSIDVATADSFSNASLTAPTLTYGANGKVNNTFSYTPGSAGSIVVVRLMYLSPTFKGPLGFNLANQPGGNQLLVATSVIKSEDF